MEYFNFIERGSKQMSHLINDLLTFSKANYLKITVEAFDPRELIQEVQSNLQFSIDDKKVRFELIDIPTSITADRNKLKQLLQNVVSNAIKFVPNDKHPEIKISCKEDSYYWTFSITDIGIGIKEEFIDKIFLPYERHNRSDEFEGTGLGLGIRKKLKEQHQGEVRAQSKLGDGTTIIFSIAKSL